MFEWCLQPLYHSQPMFLPADNISTKWSLTPYQPESFKRLREKPEKTGSLMVEAVMISLKKTKRSKCEPAEPSSPSSSKGTYVRLGQLKNDRANFKRLGDLRPKLLFPAAFVNSVRVYDDLIGLPCWSTNVSKRLSEKPKTCIISWIATLSKESLWITFLSR